MSEAQIDLIIICLILALTIVTFVALLYVIWLTAYTVKSFELLLRNIGNNQPYIIQNKAQRGFNETETIRTNNVGAESKKSQNFGISEPEPIAPKLTIPKPSGFDNG